MNIFIPANIARHLEKAPAGAIVFGTLSPQYACATVTGWDSEASTMNNKCRNIIGVVDSVCDVPFIFTRNNGGLHVALRDGSEHVCSIEVNEHDYFKRTPFDPEIQAHLHNEKVMIIGMGSVGAPMGAALAAAGVGSIVAVDKDRLEIHNAMRHVLGTSYIGWPKAVAFAHYLSEHAPSCECIPLYEDVFGGSRDKLRQLIESQRPTRILAVTDSLRVQYILQMAAIHYGIPIMAVWCDNNAVEGEVFLWEPGQAKGWQPGRAERGCYGCLRPPDKATIGRSSHFDYSSDDPDSYGGEPALGAFINRINDTATIIMLAWMLEDASRPTRLASVMDEFYEGRGLQYVRLGGPYKMENSVTLTADHPWQVKWMRVLKQDTCPYCGKDSDVEKILFPQDGDLIVGDLPDDGFESVSPEQDSAK